MVLAADYPFMDVLCTMVIFSPHDSMADRSLQRARAQQAQVDSYVQSAFEALEARALAA